MNTEGTGKKSPASFGAQRLAKAMELAGWAASHSPAFAARLSKVGLTSKDVQTPDGFRAIPVLRKKDLLALQGSSANLGGLLSVDFGALRRIYQSPGPIYDPEGREDDYWGFSEAFAAAGFKPNDLVQMTFSYHLTPAGLMLEEPLHRLGCAVIPAGPGNTQAQIELLKTLPVSGFVGMTSFLKIIGLKAKEMGLDPRRDFKLRVGFVAAERLPESLRSEVEEMFGMRIRQGYGTADVGCIAYECAELGGMHLSGRGLVEICDPQTGAPLPAGELGEVVFTPFNRSYPLIRLATGDLSALVVGQCACGRDAPRLKGVLGRVDDTAKVKGQFIYPAQAAEVLSEFPQVRAWRIEIDNPGGKDRLTLCLAVDGDCDESALSEAFCAKLKLRPLLRRESASELAESARLIDKREYD